MTDPRRSRATALPAALVDKLNDVPPSRDGTLEYWPCAVRLKGGRTLSRVIFARADDWHQVWGIWPEEDPGKAFIATSEVSDLWESPLRLPQRSADALYQHGESGMGYFVVTLRFRDGTEERCRTGSVVDFPWLPAGVSGSSIHAIELGGSTGSPPRDAPAFHWCLFR